MLHKASMDSVMMFSVELSGASHHLAPGFSLGEFQSGDDMDMVLIHPLLITGLVSLKEWAGGARVTINSAFRSVWHNNKIGGAKKSQHPKGMAADVVVYGKTPDEVAAWAESMAWGGVGRYNTFTHMDVFGFDRRWDNRT